MTTRAGVSAHIIEISAIFFVLSFIFFKVGFDDFGNFVEENDVFNDTELGFLLEKDMKDRRALIQTLEERIAELKG